MDEEYNGLLLDWLSGILKVGRRAKERFEAVQRD